MARIKRDNQYYRVHQWLIYHYGKAEKCESENCQSRLSKRFEWAQIKGKPCKKDRNNFVQMCPSCHRKYDYTIEQRKKQSKSRLGIVITEAHRRNLSIAMKDVNNKQIVQKSKNGKTILVYQSVSIAAKKLGILQTSISNVLTNRAKTAGGFIWEYAQMS